MDFLYIISIDNLKHNIFKLKKIKEKYFII